MATELLEILPGSNKEIFFDNLEHLEALEHEAKIILVLGYMRSSMLRKAKRFKVRDMRGKLRRLAEMPSREEPDLTFLGLPPEKMTVEDVESLLEKVKTENRTRERNSIQKGVELNFVKLCMAYELDDIERSIIMLLFANSTGISFRAFYEKCAIDKHQDSDGRMGVESILSIIGRDYREQMSYRKYFSMESPLVKNEFLIKRGYNMDNILDNYAYLHERIVRCILGDNSVYNTALPCIERETSSINFEKVVLPEVVKRDILKLTENYLNYKTYKKHIDEFYDYGTGLVFLFYGPSGTGKTMLAKGLANKLNRSLLSLNIRSLMDSEYTISFRDVIKDTFKEARLSGGVVFFDECDDIFKDNTKESMALLLEIEKSECVTILATNKATTLDSSLDRRITMKVPFAIPDIAQREEIWKALIPDNVALGSDVDFKQLARKYIFTGGLIKNALLMAINNAIENNSPQVVLTLKEIELAADYQAMNAIGSSRFDEIYEPDVHIEQLPIRPDSKNELLGLAALCKKFEADGFGFSTVIGSSDIHTGIKAVDAIAKECNIKVRKVRIPFAMLLEDRMSTLKDPVTKEDISFLDYAFSRHTGHHTATLLVDTDSAFERFVKKSHEEICVLLTQFLEKLRDFNGILFLVTQPLKDRYLPFEINHYMEINYPAEELQMRYWKEHLRSCDFTESNLEALIKSYPMHFNEIDYIIRQATINSHLKGGNGTIGFNLTMETIRACRRQKTTAILFGASAPLTPSSSKPIPPPAPASSLCR